MEALEDEGGWITDEEIKILLKELNPEGYVRVISPLKGSKKNLGFSTVFKVCRIDSLRKTSSNIVVKIGAWETLYEEYHNYVKYIKSGYLDAEYAVQLHEPIKNNNKAILPIDFVGLENYQILTDYYKEFPEKAIFKLLNQVLKPWHQKGTIEQRHVNNYFTSRLKYHKESLFQECERLFPGLIDNSLCLVTQVKRTLLNPVFLLKKSEFILKGKDDFWTVTSIIHGDLNFNNIFVGNDCRLKLIDYEHTCEGVVFDDFARLECEIKFTLLKNYDIPSFWQSLMDFEDYIVKELVYDISSLPDSVKEIEDLRKAAKCILVIRERVKSIIDSYSQTKNQSYWTELLIRTLKYASYKSKNNDSFLTDSQKKYALISALLISDLYLKSNTPLEKEKFYLILGGPHLINDSSLSGHTHFSVDGTSISKDENNDLIELKRALLSGNVILFLGPNAPKSSSIPTKLELARKLFSKYTFGNQPKTNKADTIFEFLLRLPEKNIILNDIFSMYNTSDLSGIYTYIPQISWKRIYVEYIDFLVERAYEKSDENKKQDYENRFSPRESRDDENPHRIIIERPYGSIRFYNDQYRSPQLSSQSIILGRSTRTEWHKLLTDIRSPISVLFYGFEWEYLKDLFYEIEEYVSIADGNSSFYWITEQISEEDKDEINLLGNPKIICHSIEEILKEVIDLENKNVNEKTDEKIIISLKNEKINLDFPTFNNYSNYFEILHDSIEKDPNYDIGSFFKGEEINWLELSKGCDVPRSQMLTPRFENKIISEFRKEGASNKCFLLLSQYAGAGTTTIMKRLGFDISKKMICPVVYLHKLDQNSWKILEAFFHQCGNHKLLILIDNVSTQLERFRELYSLLESRRVYNVILATARKDEWNQIMNYYVQNSADNVDSTDEVQPNTVESEVETKNFGWIKVQLIDDKLTHEEKNKLIQKFVDFGFLTKSASLRFGAGFSRSELRYSNLLLLCWAATQGENKKLESIVNEYYNKKLNYTGKKVVDIVCAVSLFYSKGITDKMLHRSIKVNWDNFKLLINSDPIQQLLKINEEYYESKKIYRVVPRNYGIAEILLQPAFDEFPQKILQIITENLVINEGEKVEEDILFYIVRNKNLHKYLNEKSRKDKLFEFASAQSPSDNRILQHWGIMLYDHANEQSNYGNLESPTWDEALDTLNRALCSEPYNAAILHSLGMAHLIRGNLRRNKYLFNTNDKNNYVLAYDDFDHALDYFKRSLELKPGTEHAYGTILRILYTKIEDSIKRHEEEKFENLMFQAHELLEECGNRVPIDQHVYLKERIAQWNHLRGKTLEAEQQYRRLLSENPQNHAVRYLLAVLLFDKNEIKNLAEAEIILNKAIEEGLRSKGFYRLRYKIAERLYPFDYQKLQSILNSMVSVFPEDPFFVFKYAVISFKNENYDISREYFKASDRLRFGDPSRFGKHDYIWKFTDDQSKIEQIWGKKVNESLLEKFQGNIDTINNDKGWIIMDITGQEIFFDLRSSREEIFQEGDRVQFNISFNFIMPNAINVNKI